MTRRRTSGQLMAALVALLVLAGGVRAGQERFFSRWKPDAEGWIALFDGKKLDGWDGEPRPWQVRKGGELRGNGADGMAFLVAREADWADYCLALKVMLGSAGTAVVSHGVLAAELGSARVRLGYPDQAWKTLGQKAKGLGRKKWYDVELDVRGKHAELRINGKTALQSDGHAPLAGGPALQALDGGVAFKEIRLKLHDSDRDYEAVALGKGYTEDPSKAPVVKPPEAPAIVYLRPGSHVLFNRRDLEGWDTLGKWTVRGGQMTAAADKGQFATAVVPATDKSRDYVLTVRCRLLRPSRRAKPGEYMLIVFRQQRPDNFFCIRFPMEGIFEIGGYYRGRFTEVHRGVRKGNYGEWREIEVTVRGDKIDMRVDRLGRLPSWKFTGFKSGAVGVGVAGGEAAFRDVRLRILR